jgi:hypothetical protein
MDGSIAKAHSHLETSVDFFLFYRWQEHKGTGEEY